MDEKRIHTRHDYRKELLVKAEEPSIKKWIEYHAVTLNISRGGALFRTIADFQENTACHAAFKTKGGGLFKKWGVILRVTERKELLKEGEKIFALEFYEVLAEEELTEILAAGEKSI